MILAETFQSVTCLQFLTTILTTWSWPWKLIVDVPLSYVYHVYPCRLQQSSKKVYKRRMWFLLCQDELIYKISSQFIKRRKIKIRKP